MSTGTLKTAKTEQEIVSKFHAHSDVLYSGRLTYDASPAAIEVFIGGVTNRRLQIPTDSVISGCYNVTIWNVTDDTAFMQFGVFSVGNDGGTTAVDPSELDVLTNFAAGSGSNPLIIAGNTMEGTLAIAANDTEDALTVSYTGAANDTYDFRCRLFGLVAVGEPMVHTPNQVTTSA